jgi:uncharacterized protein YbjT (DUF2867 family)
VVITVTGSTGTIGAELVRLLSQRRLPTRALLRDTTRLRALPNVAWVQTDVRDADLLEPALAGTTRLFLLSSNEPGFGMTQIQVVKAAQRFNIEHVVKLSALGASAHSNSAIAREHWGVEQALQQSGVGWIILRPHAFMQNWIGEVAESVRSEGVIYSPIGDGRVPFIDARDIAAVALEALVNPEAHGGRKYVLTGGEAVGYADLALALSKVTGRTVTYQPIAMDEARSRMQAKGVSPEMIEAMLAIAAYQKAGGPTATISDKVERILGRPPRNIRDFVRDYASYFTNALPSK